MTDKTTLKRANEIEVGMYLDLQDDIYAGFFNGEARAIAGYSQQSRELAYEDHQVIVSTFEFELAEVQAVEQETEDCVRIDTNLTSFGCPTNHRLKVVNQNA